MFVRDYFAYHLIHAVLLFLIFFFFFSLHKFISYK